ncbi:aminotransferase class I/II-fold pyridoxal phosphate-dependent enzyme [Flammeovirga yaeyamensis]|uniref:Aminotransferase class I/II-fold pyridoxal phosphate-dependent enzyme n=1 Tax=Flammeovirga yaeyamensis TaxID=367791 RepID=A0AAX1N145_9BACT|nr:pyridoxal phosphate-dependent aminotransferase family protein [Flammeovirga yaeyamensis]MBB3696399.1 glycine C-acetyltransferase [Flammeovirga yaeyamensis]NMF35078.1 pyridoxal phosphate-dependent aminotransferase family protein [Flammeovirga yaeyamensis]QWG00101.1 aminotransferase class I/II-fold pyridoxal phosphate-dependent enzyme [Flammeovirga yaeyamensis]
MDLFEKLLQDRGPLGSHSKMAHGYYAFPKLEGEIAPRMTFRGKEVLTWSLNNYLGLANHPEIRKVDADAAAEYGLAYPMGARMMSGNSNLIEEFESELSSFVGKEDTMVLNFGYQGIMSVIDALIDRKDVVVYDSECHACIIDGLRMHVGKRFVFPHNDIENCEKQLQRATKLVEQTGGAILLITEGVFGMLGDQGKLKEIADLKDKYQFRMLVDDAHGFGTLGKTGAGAGEEQGCQDKIDIYFSTFAKSMASVGAFISSDEQVIEYLRYNTRSQIFAKTLPMPLVKGNLKRLEMLRTMPELKDKLWEISTALQDGLTKNGFNIGETDTPVTPVFLQGGQNEAVNMIMDLRENYNIFCSVVVYPVVPKDVIMLRLIPTASHSLADVEETITAFKAVKHKLESGEYAKAEPQIFS